MSSNAPEYESLTDKELVKLTIERMGIVKLKIRDIRKSLLNIEGSGSRR